MTTVCVCTLQLDQMDLEIHDATPEERPMLKQRLTNYKKELIRLKKEFVRISVKYNAVRMLCTHYNVIRGCMK